MIKYSIEHLGLDKYITGFLGCQVFINKSKVISSYKIKKEINTSQPLNFIVSFNYIEKSINYVKSQKNDKVIFIQEILSRKINSNYLSLILEAMKSLADPIDPDSFHKELYSLENATSSTIDSFSDVENVNTLQKITPKPKSKPKSFLSKLFS